MVKNRCIIVEDEPLAANLLAQYIARVPAMELAGQFKETEEAAVWLLHNHADVLFLDIHLPGRKGFDFLRTLPNPPAVIVTTAYHQYAVEGFELNVIDYLLKPFSFERFAAAVRKVSGNKMAKEQESSKEPGALYLTIDRKKVRIDFDTIIYIESKREYVHVYTVNGQFISKISTTEVDGLLPKGRFVRIHRSYIVSLSRIESYTKRQVQIGDKVIKIGRGFDTSEYFGK